MRSEYDLHSLHKSIMDYLKNKALHDTQIYAKLQALWSETEEKAPITRNSMGNDFNIYIDNFLSIFERFQLVYLNYKLISLHFKNFDEAISDQYSRLTEEGIEIYTSLKLKKLKLV